MKCIFDYLLIMFLFDIEEKRHQRSCVTQLFIIKTTRPVSMFNVSNESSICEPYYPSLQIFDIDRDNKPFLTTLPGVPDLAPRGLHAGRAYKLPQPFSPTSHPSIETLYGSTRPLFVSFVVCEQCIALILFSYVKVWYLSQAPILVRDRRLLQRTQQGHSHTF